jgi:hypothetical protein
MNALSRAPPDKPAYVRFARRLQGMLIDSSILILTIASALIIAVAFESEYIARFLGVTVVVTWLLYEPLLVSMTGGTIGHYVCNLRVVDNRDGGNIGFGKATLRMALKTLLGWLSFVTMTATSRHQAIHDLLTDSTVQIRNLDWAKAHHFVFEREEVPTASRLRRIMAVVAYVLGWSAVWLPGSLLVVAQAGLVSKHCVNSDVCSRAEDLLLNAILLAWIGVIALLLGLGWRGRLWGVRLPAAAAEG